MNNLKPTPLYHLESLINRNIDDYKNRLCFRENLIISRCEDPNQSTLPVGGMCLDVQLGLNNKFLIFTSTKFLVDDKMGHSKITTWTDSKLRTIEEKREESLLGAELQKQTLYIGVQQDCLIAASEMKDVVKMKKKYPFAAITSMVSEGANFVLMRLLAICGYQGKFEMSAFYINGDLCRNIYICGGRKLSIIKNEKLNVIRIQRIIIEQCGIMHHCSTVLNCAGHLLKQEWKNCNYIIQLNPLEDSAAFNITGMTCGCENVLPLATTWKENIDLFSKYLDRKKLCEFAANNYLDDVPEVGELLADYVKNILHNKPKNVLKFSLDYFLRYGKEP